jgi:fructose-bisphosphate aldolase class II
MHFQDQHFIKYIVKAAHSASVLIAVHLDHCMEPADVELALILSLDSIMVDASRLDPEANIVYCRDIVNHGEHRGITIEAEMGRIIGGENGIPER